MFPMVAESNALQLDSGHLAKKSIIASLLLSGSGAIVLFAFPELIIKIFFGMKYLEAAGIMRIFGLAMLPMALLMILINYFIAKNRTSFSYVLFFTVVLEIIFILLFHRSLLSIIYILMGTGSILLCYGLLLLCLEKRITSV
jgi:O-antigen/teichoic acid export membrane protein